MIKTARMMSHRGALKCKKRPVDLDLVRVLPDERADRDGDDEEQDDLDADAALLGRRSFSTGLFPRHGSAPYASRFPSAR